MLVLVGQLGKTLDIQYGISVVIILENQQEMHEENNAKGDRFKPEKAQYDDGIKANNTIICGADFAGCFAFTGQFDLENPCFSDIL